MVGMVTVKKFHFLSIHVPRLHWYELATMEIGCPWLAQLLPQVSFCFGSGDFIM